eukprot:6183942-Pleurochrysis_carterae.AAC.1
MDKRQSKRRIVRLLCGIIHRFAQTYGVDNRLASAIQHADFGEFFVFLTETKSCRVLAKQRHITRIDEDMLSFIESLNGSAKTIDSGVHETPHGRHLVFHSIVHDDNVRITVISN